jgi:hypothetical protein
LHCLILKLLDLLGPQCSSFNYKRAHLSI